MTPTSEDWAEWLAHPVTKAVAAALSAHRAKSLEELASAVGRDVVHITKIQQEIADLAKMVERTTTPEGREELWDIDRSEEDSSA